MDEAKLAQIAVREILWGEKRQKFSLHAVHLKENDTLECIINMLDTWFELQGVLGGTVPPQSRPRPPEETKRTVDKKDKKVKFDTHHSIFM